MNKMIILDFGAFTNPAKFKRYHICRYDVYLLLNSLGEVNIYLN